METLLSDRILAMTLLVASMSLSVLVSYILSRGLVGRIKKRRNEMTSREQSFILSLSSLGCYAGILSFLLFVALARWEGAVLQLDAVIIVIWASMGVLLTALVGAHAVRKKVSEEPPERE